MLHTLYRFFASLWAAMGILFVFALWAVPVAMMGEADAAIFVMLFVLVFFVPCGFFNKWEEIGD